MECLKSTIISAEAHTGFCEINSIESGLCRVNKLLRDSISKYLILFAVVILGVNVIAGKFSPASVMIIATAVALIYGGFQIINIISGVNIANACR